jgi:hypothetical protein
MGNTEGEAVLCIQNLGDLDLAHEHRLGLDMIGELAGQLTVDLVVRAENVVTVTLADIDLEVRFERAVGGARELVQDQ